MNTQYTIISAHEAGWQVATYSWFEGSDEVSPLIAWKLKPGEEPDPIIPDPYIKDIADCWAVVSPDGLVRNSYGVSGRGTLEEWRADAKAWGAEEERKWNLMSVEERGAYLDARKKEQQASLATV